MTQTENITELFNRLNELKSMFRYGQKLIPIIQSLLDFMQEIAPMLENINQSIVDSTNKIPKATTQIDKVTNATELATTEILDLIDLIVSEVTDIESSALNIINKSSKGNELLDMLEKFHLPVEAMDIIRGYVEMKVITSSAENIKILCGLVLQNSTNITLSLQVQDITSQQLAAVHHLISSVKEKLVPLVQNLEETNSSEFDSSGILVPEGSSFDPNASYSRTDDRQEIADAIVNNKNQQASQDEIDRLFS